MRHFASPAFWDSYSGLPTEIQELANRSFELLKENPSHPSLHFKKVGRYWSIRVGRKYRSIGVEMDTGILWFWIGTHSEYDQLVK